MPIIPTATAMSMPCAESMDGEVTFASPLEFTASETRIETGSSATDENIMAGEVAMDTLETSMNHNPEENVDDLINAFDVGAGDSPNGCLTPVLVAEGAATCCMVETPTQSVQGESTETANPPILTETEIFDVFDDTNNEPGENIPNAERSQGDKTSTSEDCMNDALDDGFLSTTFDPVGIPTPSENVGFGKHDIVPARDGIVDNHDRKNNSGSFTREVQGIDIDTETTNNKLDLFDMHNSNDKLNSGLSGLETGAVDLGQSPATTFQTEADSPEITSLCNGVEIIQESVIGGTVLATDLTSDEAYNAEIMASTPNGMKDTDFHGENVGSYDSKQDAVTSVDDDFGEFAFPEVEMEPTDGFPLFNDAPPNLSSLTDPIKSMSETVDRNSTSLPDECATGDVITLNALRVRSNTGDEFGVLNPSVVSERLKLSTSSIADDPDADLEHVGSFSGMLSHEESFADKQSEDITSFQENGFGDFEAFADISESAIPITQDASVPERLNFPVEKEGNDPSQFQDIPPTKCVTTVSGNHDMTLVSEDSGPSLPEIGTSDEEFGDFGDFEFGDAPVDEQIEATNTMINAPNKNEEGDEFGDFDAFEEAPAKEITPLVVDSGSIPTGIVSSADIDIGDEFGDFDEFEAFDSAPDSTQSEGIDTTTNSGSKSQQMSFLNESVRRMFQDVFAYNDPATCSVVNGGSCSQLPFDVPMSMILSALPPPREIDPSHIHKSEQQLAQLKKFYENLPISPPLTVLSKVKWYPYSQYEFNRDGSPYVPTVEIVPTLTVPEVLSIELPTGFEASDLSSSTSRASPPLPISTNRFTSTVVDFPSTPTRMNHGTEHDSRYGNGESFEPDLSQLSEEGKRFMEEIPDLSYMLKSTLSLPKA